MTTETTETTASESTATETTQATETVTETTAAATETATTQTIADGATADERAAAANWPDDWRQRLAGEDKSDLKTLERLKEPKDLWSKVKNLEKKLNEKAAAPQKPGKDAAPEEIAEYRKALGIPESPEGYVEALQLPDGRVLGDFDKPIADSFAKALHEANAPPEIYNTAVGWYFKHMEEVATAEAEADDAFRAEQTSTLKEDWGPQDFKRNINAISTLFADDPEVKDLLLAGRTAEGRRIGDDARVIRLLSRLAVEINPAATVVLPGGADAKGIAARITEIEGMMSKDRQAYFKNEALQTEYRELIAARDKIQDRSKAA